MNHKNYWFQFKRWAGFAFAVLIILIVGFISYRTVINLQNSAKWVDHTHVVLEQLAIFSSDVKDVQRGARGFVIANSTPFIEPYLQAQTSVIKDINFLKELTIDNPTQQKKLDSLQKLMKPYLKYYDNLVEIRKNEGLEAAVKLTQTEEGKNLFDKILAIVNQMKIAENRLLDLRQKEDFEAVKSMKIAVTGGSILAFIIIITSAFTVMRENARRKKIEIVLRNRNIELDKLLIELKQSQDELAISEQKFRGMIQSVTDYSIFMLDAQGNIATWNEGAKRIKGYEAHEIIGQNFSRFYSQEDIKANKPNFILQHAIAKGSFQDEGWRYKKDGSSFWANVVITAIKNVDGELTGFTKITRDLTQHKKAEDALNELNHKLKLQTAQLILAKESAETADNLKSAFLATMSHELRTPLNSIIGFSGILKQELAGPFNDEQKKQLGMVQNSARHLLNLINDILDLSKIESGQVTLDIQPFDVKSSIINAVDIIKPLAEKKNIEIIVNVENHFSLLISDRRRFEQILLNLLSNAVKFTEKGSVTLHSYQDKKNLIIEIIDTGPGIPKDKISELFQPFHQLETTLSRKHEGTGLGLSIVKKLLKMMHGNIEVSSELDNLPADAVDKNCGSTFKITLKLDKKDD